MLHDSNSIKVLKLALPLPFRSTFDYLPPESMEAEQIATLRPGMRFKVKFGHQTHAAIFIGLGKPEYEISKIKPAEHLLDESSLIPPDVLDLAAWASNYYNAPIGEALHAAIPKPLRDATPVTIEEERYWTLSTEGRGLGPDSLKRSKKQKALHELLLNTHALSDNQIKEAGFTADQIKKLLDKGLIERGEKPEQIKSAEKLLKQQAPQLNEEQQQALSSIAYHRFAAYLLEGTTGSGKTEVYLQAINRVLTQGQQALVLVPEIGLTPQTISRFRNRFNAKIVELHSNVSDKQRWLNWHSCATGEAQIVIGTRLSVFTPFQNLGIIIIDEEHDLSFKQQDGIRYSARDLSIVRAQKLQIPLILGSATPSLESLNNATKQRYELLQLKQRAGNAVAPDIQLVDMRQQAVTAGLSQTCLDAISATLDRREQVLVFLNRRGYAPALLCQMCGWTVACKRCDAQMTLHRSPPHLRCHHCNTRRPIPQNCPECHNPNLAAQGHGTERFEESLQHYFSKTKVMRVDRDSMSRKQAMKELNEQIHSGEPCLLVGTQMLAKGHHFPKVTLVVIVDADAGLLSGDFRGTERAAQLITQVAGRAGRSEARGTVLLQTYKPDHPFFQVLLNSGYHQLAINTLDERQHAQLPPHWFMCILHAESKRAEIATEFLLTAKSIAEAYYPANYSCHYLGPIPSLMERREDRLRFQLQIKFANRNQLQQLLKALIPELEAQAIAKRCRWSIDVDPLEIS